MALHWNLKDIDNHEEVCWYVVTDPEEAEDIRKNGTRGFFAPAWHEDEDGTVKIMSPITNALIWMMMSLGVGGKITPRNVEEVVQQVMIEQRVRGAALRQHKEDGTSVPRYITPDEIRAHVGLKTNCSNTKRSFKENVWRSLQDGALAWVEERIKEQGS